MSVPIRMLRSLANGISALEEDLMQLDAEIAAEVERDAGAPTAPEYVKRAIELLEGLPARLEYVAAQFNAQPQTLGFIMDDEAMLSAMTARDLQNATPMRPRRKARG